MRRSVLVSGCSSGFGLVTSVTLARRGWRVLASMRNLDKRVRLDDALKEAGVAAEVVRLDVTEQDSIDECVAENGPFDAVVHNAGVSVGGAFEDLPDSEVRRIFETNVFGVFALTRAVLPAMRVQRRGRIVVVSSNGGLSGSPALSVYNSSKFAVEGWAESVNYELEPFGISVVLVEPGSYATDIWDSSPRVIPEGSAYREMADIIEPAVEKRVIARARDPQEVADTIAKAVEAERPRLRYPVGPDAVAGFVARGIVPYRAQKALVSRVLGMSGWRP